jgi:hypothetical protein
LETLDINITVYFPKYHDIMLIFIFISELEQALVVRGLGRTKTSAASLTRHLLLLS